MPKCKVSPVSPVLIGHFKHVKRSERSQIIKSKIFSIHWGFQKYNLYTCSGRNKKVDFLGCMAWWAMMKFFIQYFSFNYSPRSTSSSGSHLYEKYQGAGVYPRYYRKVGLGQWLCQKCLIVRNEFLQISSFLQTCEFLASNGPHGLQQYNQKLSVS